MHRLFICKVYCNTDLGVLQGNVGGVDFEFVFLSTVLYCEVNLVFHQRIAVNILEAVACNHYHVDQPADTKATAGKQPQDSCADFTAIKSMYPQLSKKNAQQKRS